jgi:hypothetical protein
MTRAELEDEVDAGKHDIALYVVAVVALVVIGVTL